MPDRLRLRALGALAALLHAGTVLAQNAPAPAAARVSPLEAPTVEVIGDTPLPGLGVPRRQVPANVQALTHEDLRRHAADSLPDFLESALPGVNASQIQGNRHQADVSYRGFNASPRLGIPQGLSVYLDGVRINEPFGDIVNWDLLPSSAIANLNLIPGSNPLFGLNTLGGALSLRTKSGENFPGTQAAASLGQHGRQAVGIEHGGSRDGYGWYVDASHSREDGWRDFAEGRVGTLFAKLGREDARYDVDLSLLLGESRLIGNQLSPGHLLSERWAAIYTHPDRSENRQAMANLALSRWLGDDRLVAGNVYYRSVSTREFNVDVNEVTDARFGVVPFEDGPNDAQCDPLAPPPGGCLGAANRDSVAVNRLHSRLDAFGATLQHTRLGAGNDRLTIGASHDHGRTRLRQSYQLGAFDALRSGTATGIETDSVNVLGRTTTWSLFGTGTVDLAADWQLTLAARYNRTRVQVDDRIAVPYPAPALGLDSDFRYTRLNPAAGLTYTPSERFSAYAGLNQGNRAPTPIELGCADRNAPCLLSNAVASDPYLAQVVARSGEAGLRGRAGAIDWNLGIYRTDLKDDILFVSSSTSAGYFTNFGATRRQGLEAGLAGGAGDGFSWSASYSLVDATFRSSAVLLAENNSTRGSVAGLNDDEILVSPGDRLPGIPRHALKLNGEWRRGAWSLAASLIAFSEQFVRGNENNAHRAGAFTDLAGNTRNFEGAGTTPGYAVVNLTARWRPAPRWEVSARLANLFDRRYTSGGMLGESAFPAGAFDPDSATWRRDTFYAPGAPRSLWVGVRFSDEPAR